MQGRLACELKETHGAGQSSVGRLNPPFFSWPDCARLAFLGQVAKDLGKYYILLAQRDSSAYVVDYDVVNFVT
jgi:hypothetical protein